MQTLTQGFLSDEILATSHADVAYQRYIFPATVLSCVKDIALVEEKEASGAALCEMPVVGGHELCWSLLDAIDAAFQDGDEETPFALGGVQSNHLQVALQADA